LSRLQAMKSKPILSLTLALAMLLPLASAYAESLNVTTNKDLYTAGEKAIIVGVIPATAEEGYAVLLRVSGPDGSDCEVQNILPDSDNSFVSRPVSLRECGVGQYLVTAFYAELSANSTFTVSNSSQTGHGNRLELRLLKNVAIQSQETVNQRLRVFLESNRVLPEDIADEYSLGVFEASLVLQAVDFGDTAEAKKHLIFAVRHFRGVIDSMSTDRLIFEQAIMLDAANDDSGEALLERYQRIKEFYFRLEELAQKNGVDRENEFGTIVSLLAKSKQMIDEGSLDQANQSLEETNAMLESIRQELYGNRDLEATPANSTLKASDAQAKKLANVADRFEKTAYGILEEHSGERVNATVQTVLALISQARLDIQNADYSSARSHLSDAFSALDQAKEMVKHEPKDSEGEESSKEQGSEDGSRGGEENGESSGPGGSGKSGNEDEDDQ
jgi:hypothetical protein